MMMRGFAAGVLLLSLFFTLPESASAQGKQGVRPAASAPKTPAKPQAKRPENIARPGAKARIVADLKGVQAQIARRYVQSKVRLGANRANYTAARGDADSANAGYLQASQRFKRTGRQEDRQAQREAARRLTRAKGVLANAKNALSDTYTEYQEHGRQKRELSRSISAARAGDWLAAASFSEASQRARPVARKTTIRFAASPEVRTLDMSRDAVNSRLGYNKPLK